MSPLALLVLLSIGGVGPYLYGRALRAERALEARTSAQALSEQYAQLAARSPELWRYKTRSLLREAQLTLRRASFVSVEGIQGAPLTLKGVRSTLSAAPIIGRVAIEVGGRRVGWVSVALSQAEQSDARAVAWVFGGSLGVLVALAVLLIPLSAARRGDKLNDALWRALNELNQALEERVAQRTRALDTLNLRLLTIQEEERARVSRDLHDELGQTLTALRLQLTTLTLLPPEQRRDLELINALISAVDTGVEQVRSLAYELRPPELEHLGLSLALKRHVERRAQAAGLKVSVLNELSDEETAQLSAELSAVIFRVVQEGLTNVLRHANAHKVWVRLKRPDRSPSQLMIEVEDDGVGPPHHLQEGLGLLGVQARAREVSGEASLLSGPKGGALLRVILSA